MKFLQKIDQLGQWLSAQEDILLLCHVSPDGDTIGSALGLGLALTAAGKRVCVHLPDRLPDVYSFLPGQALLCRADSLPFEPKAALSVDVSEKQRMGEDGFRLFDACENNAMMDHHPSNPGFGEIGYLDGTAAATGEIVVGLLQAMNLPIPADAAACLYTAIATDCGNFNFSNTSGRALRAAADCVDAGANAADITERVYRSRSRAKTHLLGIVLSGMEVSEDGRFAFAKLTNAMLERAGAKPEDSDGIVNYLVEIIGVEFAALAQERGADITKFSLRSVTGCDLALRTALCFDGGGHANAAGCTIRLPVDEALNRLKEKLA